MLNLLFYISLLILGLLAILRLGKQEEYISNQEQEFLQIQNEMNILAKRKQLLNIQLENIKQNRFEETYSKDIGLFIIQTQNSNQENNKISILSAKNTPLNNDRIA
ncbi:MAG: hypothetical protein GX326_05870 [Clostridiaceae bacterium]|nr:hypothetical protein [Clostridiaceae bacterium]